MFKFLRPERYHSVTETEDTEWLISSPDKSGKYHNLPLPRTLPVATLLLLLASSFISAIFGLWVGRQFQNLDAICTDHVSKYSPIVEDINISYNVVKFSGSFKHENIYRQDAGPEVDAAWDALGGRYRPIVIPDSLAEKSGLTKDHGRRKADYGGGYIVHLEGMHQMHCLNFLRKSLFYNYDYYKSLGEVEFSNSDRVVRWHITHCLDFIRQRLMCTVDIGVLGSVWVNRTEPMPWPDFNTKHVCRNYDEIRAWAEKHQIPEDVPDDYMELPTEDIRVLDEIP